MATPNLTDEFMGEYVREHRCYAALSVSIADWDRGVREIERAERARILAALPEALERALETEWSADYDRDAVRPDFARRAAALAAAIEKLVEEDQHGAGAVTVDREATFGSTGPASPDRVSR